jgi:16S rRNA (guanine527-N7)-methyltransferase
LKVKTNELEAAVTRGAEELGIALPRGAGVAFAVYYDFLEQRRKDVNLTAITGEEKVASLHFLDSLAPLKTYDFCNKKVIHVGSGAGFPGVPIKLAEPSVDLTLLDATGKRVEFLLELCALLSIDATCIHARAEELAHVAGMRESYDVALSRGVAQLNILCELCLPFVRVGGVFLAMKSVDSRGEIAAAHAAIQELGAELGDITDYTIPGTDVIHRAVLILKTSKTPEKYPRRFARIQRDPL